MKHKHYDMIMAKAASMELVVFEVDPSGKNKIWSECYVEDGQFPQFFNGNNYFLCLPKHKEACLHWLNGGECQQSPLAIEQWVATGSNREWAHYHSFMQEKLRFRIKPKKEKRWIAVNTKTNKVCSSLFESELEAIKTICLDMDWQFIEIEAEV